MPGRPNRALREVALGHSREHLPLHKDSLLCVHQGSNLPSLLGAVVQDTPWPDVTVAATLTVALVMLLDTVKLKVLLLDVEHTVSDGGPTMVT